MSDPVLALILMVAASLAIGLASAFKTLDGGIWRDATTPLIVGVIVGVLAGVLIRIVGPATSFGSAVAIGLLLTIAALYVRLTGRESEPADGMALGALTGIAAALPLLLAGAAELEHFTSCLLSGAVAGYGITFGLTRVTEKLKQLAIDAATAALAIGAAALPGQLMRNGANPAHVAVGAALLVPLLLAAAVFVQWPAVRRELAAEATLGVIDDSDVKPTAHPLRRLGRSGWYDRSAHREFVRTATRLALRKRQQQGRPEEIARLYQLEVIKLRMQLQEMSQIDRAMRRAASLRHTARD